MLYERGLYDGRYKDCGNEDFWTLHLEHLT